MARQSVSGAAKCAASRREPAAVTQRSKQPSSVCDVVLILVLEPVLELAPHADAGLVDEADGGTLGSPVAATADDDNEAAVAVSSAAAAAMTRCSGA